MSQQDQTNVNSSEETENKCETTITDEFGAVYTADGLKLIRVPEEIKSYEIKPGTGVIGDEAFIKCTSLQSIAIPDSVTSIGNFDFNKCTSLREIRIPQGTKEKFEELLGEEWQDKLVEV